MIRRVLMALVLLSFAPATATSAPQKAVVNYRQEIAKGDYSKALMALHKAVRTSRSLTPEESFGIESEEATFYENYVGDIDHALSILKKVGLQATSLDAEKQKNLDNRVQALEKLILEHRDEKRLIDRFVALEPKEQKAMAHDVQTQIERAAAKSPYLGALNHCLGLAHFEAEHYHAAYNAFDKALAINPAIFFKYPTKELQKKALALWEDHALPTIGSILASILLVLVPLGFVLTRPHKWIRWGHLLPLPVLLVFWAIAHQLVIALSSALADETVQKGGNAIVNTQAGAVMSAPLTSHLFVYGAIAVVTIYFASLAISRVQLPMTRYVANVCAGFCITGTLMLCFVLSYGQTELLLNRSSSFQHMSSSFRYVLTDPVPYLLTSPKDFPGLAAQDMDEEFLREYVEQMGYFKENGDE